MKIIVTKIHVIFLIIYGMMNSFSLYESTGLLLFGLPYLRQQQQQPILINNGHKISSIPLRPMCYGHNLRNMHMLILGKYPIPRSVMIKRLFLYFLKIVFFN